MAAFSVFDVSGAKGILPVIIVAGAGLAGIYLWSRAQSNAAAAAGNPAPNTLWTQLANLSLLQKLTGTGAQNTAAASTTPNATPQETGGSPYTLLAPAASANNATAFQSSTNHGTV